LEAAGVSSGSQVSSARTKYLLRKLSELLKPFLLSAARLRYRPDIDGVRAIVVTGVVLFHAALFLHSGFVGVDIFLRSPVISLVE
jgi:hypothetical protein